MVNLAYIEEMAEKEMRKKRQRRQMLARQNASRSQRMPKLDEPPPVQEERGGILSSLFKRFPDTQLGDSGYADTMIEGQMESDRLAEFDERFSPVAGVQGPEDFYPRSEAHVEGQEGVGSSGPRSLRGVRGVDWRNLLFSRPGESEYWPPTEEGDSGYSDVMIGNQVEPEKATVEGAEESIVEGVVGLLGSPETEETLSGIEGEVLPATSNLIEEDVVRDTIEGLIYIGEPDFDPRIYDHYGEDIDGKEQRYLAALGDIYKKVAILNVVAALTNSPSQAGAFMQMASKKFETLEGFRTEKRMQKIGKGVFFTEDGKFHPPKTKQEAYERAIAFGASPDEAAAISGDVEETATTTGSYTTWYNKDTGEEETFRPGFAPVDEEGNIIPGWIKGSKPQHTDRERLYSAVDRLAQTGTLEDARQAYLQLKRYFSTSRDPVTQQLLATMGTAHKAAAQHLSDAYKFQNLPLPPGLQFGESGEAIFSTEGGERSEELIGKITVVP